MYEQTWKLRCKPLGHRTEPVTEITFVTEARFVDGLQLAYRELATDIVAILPNGYILTEAVARRRYPPQQSQENPSSTPVGVPSTSGSV